MKKIIAILLIVTMLFALSGCTVTGEYQNTINQQAVTNSLLTNQPTPTDITYSLERFNLIKRAYWVNGQIDRASSLPNPIQNMPLGYVVLLTEGGAIFGKYIVDGKVSSLNSYLSPDSEYYSSGNSVKWLADVDGSYGENQQGIFFFTTDGNYVEWTGKYFYSNAPVQVETPVLTIENATEAPITQP